MHKDNGSLALDSLSSRIHDDMELGPILLVVQVNVLEIAFLKVLAILQCRSSKLVGGLVGWDPLAKYQLFDHKRRELEQPSNAAKEDA